MFHDHDFISKFNRMFANVDNYFRDFEKEHGVRGIFPTITIPSILNTLNELFSSEETDTTVTFYKNGKVHREDGPAVVYKKLQSKDPNVKLATPENEYWLEGKQVTQKDVEDLVAKKEEEKVYTIYVGEKEYKIKGKKKLEEFEKLLK